MNRDAGSQLHVQPPDNLGGKCAGLAVCRENRNIILPCQLQHVFIRNGARRIDNRRNLRGQESLIDFPPPLPCERVKVGVFHITDNLQAVRVEIIKVTRQLQSRPVHLIRCKLLVLQVHRLGTVHQCHLFYQFLNRNAGLCVHILPSQNGELYIYVIVTKMRYFVEFGWKNSYTFRALAAFMEGACARRSGSASRIASKDPKQRSRAFLLAGPIPSISSSMERVCAFPRRDR